MAILKISRLGHPVLRERARELSTDEIRSPEIGRLIQDMIETMREYGGIGLAAPQVHRSVRLAVVEFSEDSARYPEMGMQPLAVFINPKVTVLDPQEQSYWEGCLSIPELRGLVHRSRKIRVDYLDIEGKNETLEAEGFLATVLQHELDHLSGFLFVDRMKDMTQLAFLEEYRRYHLPAKSESEGVLDA